MTTCNQIEKSDLEFSPNEVGALQYTFIKDDGTGMWILDNLKERKKGQNPVSSVAKKLPVALGTIIKHVCTSMST